MNIKLRKTIRKYHKRRDFLMLYRYSMDFLEEKWNLNVNFELKNNNNESDWAREPYLFIVSEWIDDWKNPKDFISKEDLWTILFNFFKDYSEFKSEKNPQKWCERNWILNSKNLSEDYLRINFWDSLLTCTEILEG